MPFASQSPALILRRLEELEDELRRTRTDLKNLRSHDPALAEVVLRGARLSQERSSLEHRLELLRGNSAPAARVSRPSRVDAC